MVNFKKYGISSPQDLMDYFEKNMQYGFVEGKKIYTESEPNFQEEMDKHYKLRLGEDFLKNKYGVCWDFCVLEREFLRQAGIENQCYFIEGFLNRQDGGPTHTFAIYKQGKKWLWFEYSWFCYRGIHEYDSLEEALDDVVKKFKSFYDVQFDKIKVFELPEFDRRLDTFEFAEKCLQGKEVIVQDGIENAQ